VKVSYIAILMACACLNSLSFGQTVRAKEVDHLLYTQLVCGRPHSGMIWLNKEQQATANFIGDKLEALCNSCNSLSIDVANNTLRFIPNDTGILVLNLYYLEGTDTVTYSLRRYNVVSSINTIRSKWIVRGKEITEIKGHSRWYFWDNQQNNITNRDSIIIKIIPNKLPDGDKIEIARIGISWQGCHGYYEIDSAYPGGSVYVYHLSHLKNFRTSSLSLMISIDSVWIIKPNGERHRAVLSPEQSKLILTSK
jgi:hypothetical protein